MSDCVIRSVALLLNEPPGSIYDYFEWGKDRLEDGTIRPPSVHQVIDFLLDSGIALTPISRVPVSQHCGQVIRDMTDEEAEARWSSYLEWYTGLLIGLKNGVGHMAYVKDGTVHDRETYDYNHCYYYGFEPDTFMVATWEA